MKKHLAALGIIGAVTVGATLPAIAQEDTGTTTTTEDGTTETAKPDREAARAERQAAFSAALAEKLGLDADTVGTAVSEVRAEMKASRDAERDAAWQARLDESVANGDLTQEQADALVAARESGAFEGLGRGGRGGHRGHGGGGSADAAAPADAA